MTCIYLDPGFNSCYCQQIKQNQKYVEARIFLLSAIYFLSIFIWSSKYIILNLPKLNYFLLHSSWLQNMESPSFYLDNTSSVWYLSVFFYFVSISYEVQPFLFSRYITKSSTFIMFGAIFLSKYIIYPLLENHSLLSDLTDFLRSITLHSNNVFGNYSDQVTSACHLKNINWVHSHFYEFSQWHY